jgi:hypothetical protein
VRFGHLGQEVSQQARLSLGGLSPVRPLPARLREQVVVADEFDFS